MSLLQIKRLKGTETLGLKFGVLRSKGGSKANAGQREKFLEELCSLRLLFDRNIMTINNGTGKVLPAEFSASDLTTENR